MSAFAGVLGIWPCFSSLVWVALEQLFSKKCSVLLDFSFLGLLAIENRLWEGLFYPCLLIFLGY